MTTYFQAISAAGSPESIYYDGRCLWKVRDPMPDGPPLRTVSGIKLTADQFKSYESCADCYDENTTNTLYVRYEP